MAKIQGVHTPLKLSNFVINGGLDFWQMVAGTTTTVNTATTTVNTTADMIKTASVGATVKNYSVVRSTDIPSLAQSGFQSTYSLLFTMLTGISSFAAGDWVNPAQYRMEGLDYAKIHSKTVTVGFWVKASIAGTYSFAVQNGAANRSYVTTFSINGANTWEFKTITLTLDNTGTYLFDTGIGLIFYIGTVAGATFSTASLNTWQAGEFYHATTGTNWMATTNATLRVSQISLVEGSLGLGATGFTKAGDTIEDEFALCQRYYEKSYDLETAPGAITTTGALEYTATTSTSGGGQQPGARFAVRKRIIPVMVLYSTTTGAPGKTANINTGLDVTITSEMQGEGGFNTYTAGVTPTAGHFVRHQFVADSRL